MAKEGNIRVINLKITKEKICDLEVFVLLMIWCPMFYGVTF